MKRQSNVPFNPSASVYKQPQPGRIPLDFREAMKHISVKPADSSNTRTADTVAKTPPPPRKRAGQWKSSFKPVGGEEEGEEGEGEDNSPDKSKSSPERVELYNPYDPASSDSEHEMPRRQDHNRSPADQDNNLGHQHLSPSRGCRDNRHWDSSYSEPGNRPLDRRDLNPETRPTECRSLSPGHRLPERRAFSPDTESLVPPGYGSMSRPVDHRVRSPDRLIHSSSTQRFPAPYAGQRTNGEEKIPITEYRRETTTVRLSPPRLQRDYQHQSGYMKTGKLKTDIGEINRGENQQSGLDELTPSKEKIRNGNKKIIMDKSPITCDLCEVELANGQELQDHLESKTHWDTLEHIQQENHYDDMAIAFLQEVMLFKSRQCSRAIEDSVLQALQENDHMTKIEIFHCAACNIFLSTSAASVQTHITSQEHLANTKEFEVQQRRACLHKAETMMKELKPQFEHFLKGGSPFE